MMIALEKQCESNYLDSASWTIRGFDITQPQFTGTLRKVIEHAVSEIRDEVTDWQSLSFSEIHNCSIPHTGAAPYPSACLYAFTIKYLDDAGIRVSAPIWMYGTFHEKGV